MENTDAIARIEHLAKIYAAQALKPPHAQRPQHPGDLPNAQALTRVADLARVGAEVIAGQVGWRGNMCMGHLDLATELVARGIAFDHHGSGNPSTTAAVTEIDRLRAEVEADRVAMEEATIACAAGVDKVERLNAFIARIAAEKTNEDMDGDLDAEEAATRFSALIEEARALVGGVNS